jgi:hypothetical protein
VSWMADCPCIGCGWQGEPGSLGCRAIVLDTGPAAAGKTGGMLITVEYVQTMSDGPWCKLCASQQVELRRRGWIPSRPGPQVAIVSSAEIEDEPGKPLSADFWLSKRAREECRRLGKHDLPVRSEPGDVHVCGRCDIKRTILPSGRAVYGVEQF